MTVLSGARKLMLPLLASWAAVSIFAFSVTAHKTDIANRLLFRNSDEDVRWQRYLQGENALNMAAPSALRQGIEDLNAKLPSSEAKWEISLLIDGTGVSHDSFVDYSIHAQLSKVGSTTSPEAYNLNIRCYPGRQPRECETQSMETAPLNAEASSAVALQAAADAAAGQGSAQAASNTSSGGDFQNIYIAVGIGVGAAVLVAGTLLVANSQASRSMLPNGFSSQGLGRKRKKSREEEAIDLELRNEFTADATPTEEPTTPASSLPMSYAQAASAKLPSGVPPAPSRALPMKPATYVPQNITQVAQNTKGDIGLPGRKLGKAIESDEPPKKTAKTTSNAVANTKDELSKAVETQGALGDAKKAPVVPVKVLHAVPGQGLVPTSATAPLPASAGPASAPAPAPRHRAPSQANSDELSRVIPADVQKLVSLLCSPQGISILLLKGKKDKLKDIQLMADSGFVRFKWGKRKQQKKGTKLVELQQVLTGLSTEGIKKFGNKVEENLYFSLVFRDRTLDFQARSAEECSFYASAFRQMLVGQWAGIIARDREKRGLKGRSSIVEDAKKISEAFGSTPTTVSATPSTKHGSPKNQAKAGKNDAPLAKQSESAGKTENTAPATKSTQPSISHASGGSSSTGAHEVSAAVAPPATIRQAPAKNTPAIPPASHFAKQRKSISLPHTFDRFAARLISAEGIQVIKHPRHGDPEPRILRADGALKNLSWYELDGSNKHTIPISTIHSVTKGRSTTVLEKSGAAGKDHLYFSVIADTRSLDLEVKSVEERDFLLSGFQMLADLSELQHGSSATESGSTSKKTDKKEPTGRDERRV